MDQLAAAKFLILGWIKDWHLWRVALCLDSKIDPEAEPKVTHASVHARWPFMPTGHWGNTRAYMRLADRKLNDLLWDAPDNAARMALAERVLRIDGSKKRRSDETRVVDRDNLGLMRRTKKSYRKSLMERGLGMDAAAAVRDWGATKAGSARTRRNTGARK